MLRAELLATSHAKSGSRLHLLVDPALGDPLPDLPGSKVPVPIAHDGLRGAHCPYLLRVQVQGALFKQSLMMATQEAKRQRDDVPGARAICGWIFTNASTSELAEHLALHAQLPSPSGMRLLRYWDPRVMDLLHAMLDERQIRILMGPALAWHWSGRDVHLRTLLMPAGVEEVQGALDFTQEQHKTLEQAAHVNATLDALQDDGYDMAAVDALRLARCLSRGREVWNLTTPHEHILYALHCALIGESFDEIPKVREAMTAELNQGRSAVSALDRFDEAYWQQAAKSQSRTVNP